MLFVSKVKKKQSETLIFSKASKALDCFSQRICRTLMAVAGLSPPPCDMKQYIRDLIVLKWCI